MRLLSVALNNIFASAMNGSRFMVGLDRLILSMTIPCSATVSEESAGKVDSMKYAAAIISGYVWDLSIRLTSAEFNEPTLKRIDLFTYETTASTVVSGIWRSISS